MINVNRPRFSKIIGVVAAVVALSWGTAAQAHCDTLFETLVRVHRAGEGAPYTGLKPAGEIEPAIAAADKSIASGKLQPRRRQVVSFEPLAEDHDPAGEADNPEQRLHAKQTIAGLQVALARLSVEQREILLLREVEGLSYQELSRALGIDEGTVKSRLARGRAALAELYTRMQT